MKKNMKKHSVIKHTVCIMLIIGWMRLEMNIL